jgi:hypothetical protein
MRGLRLPSSTTVLTFACIRDPAEIWPREGAVVHFPVLDLCQAVSRVDEVTASRCQQDLTKVQLLRDIAFFFLSPTQLDRGRRILQPPPTDLGTRSSQASRTHRSSQDSICEGTYGSQLGSPQVDAFARESNSFSSLSTTAIQRKLADSLCDPRSRLHPLMLDLWELLSRIRELQCIGRAWTLPMLV